MTDKEDVVQIYHYSAIKRKENGSFVVMWMNPGSVIQSKVGQKDNTNTMHINTCI